MTEKTPDELRAQRAQLIASTGLSEVVLRERAEAFQLYPEHLDVWRTVEGIDYFLNDDTDAGTDPTPVLVQVGWYCWRCHGIVAQACRSDNVPVHVPADWVEDMTKEIAEREGVANTDRLAGTPTPGCTCGHDGMGAAWHERGVCQWLLGEASR
jgi:hypothetical protein